MKNILRENMRRFGTKNLKESIESTYNRDINLDFIRMALQQYGGDGNQAPASLQNIKTKSAEESDPRVRKAAENLTQVDYDALSKGDDTTQTADAGMYATSVLNTTRFSESIIMDIRKAVENTLSQSQWNRIVNSKAYKFAETEYKRKYATEPNTTPPNTTPPDTAGYDSNYGQSK